MKNKKAIIIIITAIVIVVCFLVCLPTIFLYTGNYTAAVKMGMKEIVIPNGVTRIEDQAFRGCDTLESIVMPNSVTQIGESAFLFCSNLNRVVFSDNITSIGDDAFRDCSSLERIVLPNNLRSIGDRAFCDCTSLSDIVMPESLTGIGHWVFGNCDNLTEIYIPKKVRTIEGSLGGGVSLEKIDVASENVYYHSKDNCLIETYTKTLITGCKNSIIPNDGSIITIGDSAFMGCTQLTEILIPNPITNIGQSAFSNCTNLKTVIIPKSVEYIGLFAFNDCTALENATFEKTANWKLVVDHSVSSSMPASDPIPVPSSMLKDPTTAAKELKDGWKFLWICK